MNTVIVQKNASELSSVMAVLEDSGRQIVASDASRIAEDIKRIGNNISGLLLSEVGHHTHNVVRLVRNGRYCHPWVPIAIFDDPVRNPASIHPVEDCAWLNDGSNDGMTPEALPLPVGCRAFSSADSLSELGQYLTEPTPLKILLVEDDPGIRDMLSQALGSHYDVTTAVDGSLGETAFLSQTFDLAMIDHRLPGALSGLDLVKRIRAINKSIPIITITAYDDSERELASFVDGANEYLTKPFHSISHVRKTIVHVLSQATLLSERTSPASPLQSVAWGSWNGKMYPFD